MEPLLSDLQKKDSDLQVIEETYNGVIIKTSLDIGEEIVEETEETIETPYFSVPLKLTRHLFAINFGTSTMFALFGIIPYHLLKTNEIAALSIMGTSIFISVMLYIALYLLIHHKYVIPIFLTWLIVAYSCVFSIAASLSNLAPFQGCVIFSTECISVVLLCFACKKKLDPWWAALTMVISGMVIWFIGIYAFVKEQDWITSGILFLTSVILIPFYSAYQIHLINNSSYNLSDLIFIQFYTDVIGRPIKWIQSLF